MLPMLFLTALVSLVSWTELVTASSLRITADHHSFGGVNYPQLQFFTPQHRDDTIREIVKSGARVIRLFIRPDELHPDPESELGGFDKSMLDQFDDTLAAIHHLSKGQVKVIIAPHDAHALRGSNDVPCDAYCKKLNGAFLDFYSLDEYRELYKTRLSVFFQHYPSKNFDGRPWSSLSEIILGVDIQNQPFSSIWPIPAGESWICDMATYLHSTINLSAANIAVISGGVSGPQSADGIENFPESVLECDAIDVIGIHGYYSKQSDATAGAPWANMFVPGNTLTSRVLGDEKEGKGKGKLLLVEEWSYVHSEEFGLFYKNEAVWDQGNALNYRGIPWLYSHLTSLDEAKSSRINPLRPQYTTWAALRSVLTQALTARSAFNWSRHLSPPFKIVAPTATEETEQYLRAMLTSDHTKEWKLAPMGLSNVTSVPLNPYVIEQGDCTFGCEGHLCDAADGCAPHLLCKNNICQVPGEAQPGKVGDKCNSKTPCLSHLRCEKGRCGGCSARQTIQPEQRKRKSSILGLSPQRPGRRAVQPNDPKGTCYTDSLEHLFAVSAMVAAAQQDPICLPPTHHAAPCHSSTHCSANEYCDWGACTPCLSTDACLGAPCRSNAKCKTGYCNDHGRCDYPGQKKRIFGPGANAGRRSSRVPGVPVGQEYGGARVRNEAMRVVIPEEGAAETRSGK